MIALRDVRIEIAGRVLLDELNLGVSQGEFLAVLGPNGVGKTTLLRTLTGLIPPAAGSIVIEGLSIASLSHAERARRVAFVASDDVIGDALRVRDVVAIGRYPHHRWWQWQETPEDARAIETALCAVQLQAFGDRLFSTLSSGERQRAWIAMGLAQETPVLVLDEPTSHLDVRVAHEILGLLRGLARAGKTIACVLHDLNDAATYADKIALLGCGRLLVCDRPEVVFGASAIEQAYGQRMERVTLAHGGVRIFAVDEPL